MEPLLQAGDEVLVRSLSPHPLRPRSERVRVGDLVVAQHPQRPGLLLIKQWGCAELQSFCHKQCGIKNARRLGVVTSRL